VATTTDTRPDARERILDSAYALFSTRGVHDVGIDEVIGHADVAKATLYRHFASKDALVHAFLERRERLWTREWLETAARKGGSTPEERLLAIFDVFDGWFRAQGFEGCSFVNILLEMTPKHELGQASIAYLASIRSLIRAFAEEACLREPESFARSFHILMKGAIVSAGEGDTEAAQRAKAMARLLIAEYR